MAAKNLHCLAQVVLHHREQLVLLRPMDKLLCMTTLHHQTQIKPATLFEDELTATSHSRDELKLVNMLIDPTTKPLDFAQYKDLDTERLTQRIETKVEGKELVAAPSEAPQQVINLMEASDWSPQPPHRGNQRQNRSGLRTENGTWRAVRYSPPSPRL